MRLLTQRLSTARVAMHDARLKADAQMAVVESQARAIAQIEDEINKQQRRTQPMKHRKEQRRNRNKRKAARLATLRIAKAERMAFLLRVNRDDYE